MITLHFSSYWLIPVVAVILLIIAIVGSRDNDPIGAGLRFIGLLFVFLVFTCALFAFHLFIA